jgi:D-alanine--D-alanine ligase
LAQAPRTEPRYDGAERRVHAAEQEQNDMRIVLSWAMDPGAAEGAAPPQQIDDARAALRRLGHEVEVIALGASVPRFAARLEAAAPDAVLPLSWRHEAPRAREQLLLTLVEALGLSTVGASARSATTACDAKVAGSLLRVAGLPVTPQGTGAPAGRVHLAWLRGDPTQASPAGVVAQAAGGLFEPRGLDEAAAKAVSTLVEGAVAALELHDWALFSIDLGPAGEAQIACVDPLPCFDPASPAAASLAARGLSLDAALERVVASCSGRLADSNGSSPPSRRAAEAPLRVGLAFNVKRTKPELGGNNDGEAEFDSPETIEAIAAAIRTHGHDVVMLEATPELATRLRPGTLDVVFNIAEGMRGRSREAQVPALLELIDVPYTGSDPATLALALDKGLAKRIVKQAGVQTPTWVVLHTGNEKLPRDLSFPVVVKPVAEGSSKGVLAKSVAETEAELREVARALVARYPDGALVEEFLPGREFTVGLLGEHGERVLPPMEIVFRADLKNPIYTFDHKQQLGDEVRYEVPARVDPALRKQLEKVARASFAALGCRDVARIDVRLDARGRVNFIECNPLPGLSPGWSDLCMIATAVGMDYQALIGAILAPAVERFRVQQAARSITKGPVQ